MRFCQAVQFTGYEKQQGIACNLNHSALIGVWQSEKFEFMLLERISEALQDWLS